MNKEGLIKGNHLAALVKQSITDTGFKSEYFGSEMLHGAIQENATEFHIKVLDKYDSGKIKEILFWNNGNTPSEELLGSRMINFDTVPNNNGPNAISKRGLGFKKEAHRAGGWLSRYIPGPDNKIIEQKFTYCYDTEGKNPIPFEKYTVNEIMNKCQSVYWEIIETDIDNKEMFPSGFGIAFKHFIYENCPIKVDLKTLQCNLEKRHSECSIKMRFIDMDNELPKKKVYHRIFNESGELKRSYTEHNLYNKPLKVKTIHNEEEVTLEFDFYHDHRIMDSYEGLSHDKFERICKNNIEYKYPKARPGSPLLSMIGPREIILSLKSASSWYSGWDYNKYQGLIVTLKPRQDMSDLFGNVKSDGSSDETIDSDIESAVRDLIKSDDVFNSPHWDKSKKPEDSLVDQFLEITRDKTEGKNNRLSWQQLGANPSEMIPRKNWIVRKSPGAYENDLRFKTNNIDIGVEVQVSKSDVIHLNGLFGRTALDKEYRDSMIWVAESHNHYTELVDLLKTLCWNTNDNLKKIYLITTKQFLKGFELDDIDYIIDIEKDIK
tara:strand:- start:82 stop:1728 length:1647 start_codon:yes stop_codon:yes gene_type:complete